MHFIREIKNKDSLCDWARQSQNGNEQAFAKLYDSLKDSVFVNALSMLKSEEDADETVNDVFLKVWQNIDQWHYSRCKFTTWFYNVSKRLIIDKYRRKKSYNRNHVYDTSEHALDNVCISKYQQPLESLVINEVCDNVENLLCNMPQKKHRQRLCWILFNIENYSYSEISDITHIKLVTVRSHVYRCNQFLKNNISDYRGE